MNNQENSRSNGSNQVKLPSFFEAVDLFMENGNFSFWSIFGYVALQFKCERFWEAVCSIFPLLNDDLLLTGILFSNSMINCFFIFYLGMVSHLLPSKPVGGDYKKPGLELVFLLAAVVQQWFLGYKDLYLMCAIITEFHALRHLLYRPPDLNCWDWLLDALMQVAVYGCGSNKYAIVATTVVCLLVIYHRFRS